MKKVMILLLLSGACLSTTHAQLSVGLRFGAFSSSYWSYKGGEGGNRLLTMPHFGALAEYAFSERLSLRAELNHAPKGDAWYFDTREGDKANYRDVYNYLEIPLTVHYRFGSDNIRPYAYGGVYAARALSNKYTEKNRVYDFDNFTRGDVGLLLGAGATAPLGPGHAFVELRLAQGLKNIDAFSDGTSTRLRGFGCNIGWKLPLQL